jgi:Undecaprenyl-phosphate galactose phosphotransferase WbaP
MRTAAGPATVRDIMTKIQKLICLAALILSDLAALLASFLLGFLARNEVLIGVGPFSARPLSLSTQISSTFLAGSFLVLLTFSAEKLYTRRFFFWEEARVLIRSVSLSFVLLLTFVFVSRSYKQTSRVVILLAWGAGLVLFPAFRFAVKRLLAAAGAWHKNLLILGTGRAAQRVVREILKDGGLGYRIMGYISEEGGNVGARLEGNLPVLGSIPDLDALMKGTGTRDIIIALSDRLQHRLAEIAKHAEPLAENIKIVPPVGNLFTTGVHIDNLGDVIAMSVPRNLSKPWNLAGKRAFETAAVVPILVLLSPLLLLVAAAIAIDSRGPLIYSQRRLGRNGARFRILKFRSMFVDAEARLEKRLARDPALRQEWETYHKIKGRDPRVTRVGRVLRHWSIDELPQLVNVLRGEMSLVGPRPYMPSEIGTIGPAAEIISRVKPGITGLWQVRGRNRLSFEDRLLLDETYVRNWSLWLDIVILIKTFTVLARREGAF